MPVVTRMRRGSASKTSRHLETNPVSSRSSSPIQRKYMPVATSMTYLKLLSSPMLCGWRWYTMRLSDFARSRQTSSVSSVEALSEMTSSRFSWSCARTERTTSATRGPASRTGRPIDTSASAFDMRTPFSGRLRLRRTEVHVAQERQQGHGDRCASGQRQQAPRKEHGGASVTAARHVQLEADDGRCAGESEYRNGGVR